MIRSQALAASVFPRRAKIRTLIGGERCERSPVLHSRHRTLTHTSGLSASIGLETAPFPELSQTEKQPSHAPGTPSRQLSSEFADLPATGGYKPRIPKSCLYKQNSGRGEGLI